jgi:hypothetical protein
MAIQQTSAGDDRWAIYIDVQGFGKLWDTDEDGKDRALAGLGCLMQAIFRIGSKCYPIDPERAELPSRIFAYQFGDGFIIQGEGEPGHSFEHAVTITIALLRHMAAFRCFAKAAIVKGSLSDINGCYPREVTSQVSREGVVKLGQGVMTLVPVMGTALTRGNRMEKAAPKGPLLVTDEKNVPLFPPGMGYAQTNEDKSTVSVDWLHYESKLLDRLQRDGHLSSSTTERIEQLLRNYCSTEELPNGWVQNANKYLNVQGDSMPIANDSPDYLADAQFALISAIAALKSPGKHDYTTLKSTLARIRELLPFVTDPVTRKQLEETSRAIAGYLMSPWLPWGIGRKLVMLTLVTAGICGSILSGTSYWLLLLFVASIFSPRLTGEATYLAGRISRYLVRH